jgi:YlmC/YmxH family sporulation protein
MLKVSDVKTKEVINIANGERLGYIYDFEIDLEKGIIIGIIMSRAAKGLGLFAKVDDILIDWEDIVRIGTDTILVNFIEE